MMIKVDEKELNEISRKAREFDRLMSNVESAEKEVEDSGDVDYFGLGENLVETYYAEKYNL